MRKTLFCLGAFVGTFCLAGSGVAKTEIVPPKIGMVTFKKCVEESKVGKKEKDAFESQKKQMEQDLDKKQRELKELAPKFSEEYLDSLTPEAEKELREKFERLNHEFSEQQNQFYQIMEQSHFQSMQKIYEMTAKASADVAKEKNLDFVINDEVCFYKKDAFDVTVDVIKKLDDIFVQTTAEEAKK